MAGFVEVKHINISDLPHLNFIRYHSSDYYRRVLAWEHTQESEKDLEQIIPPEILTENRTTVYYKRTQCNSFKFFTSIEKVERENHIATSNGTTGKSKCTLATNEFDGKILIIDKEHEDVSKRPKLDLDQESINGLTEAVEGNIFQYIKLTIDRFQKKMKEGQGHLNNLIMTGNAILRKHTNHQNTTQKIPDLNGIFEKLDNFHDDGVIGFGAGNGIIYVFALVRERNNEEKQTLVNKIDEIVKGVGHLVIWFDESPFSCFTKAGDLVVSKSKINEFKTKAKGFGAVGACGRTGNKDVFTTAGHLFPLGNGEEAFVIGPASNDSGDQSVKPIRIGICKAHLGCGEENSADFAVVEMDENSTKISKTIGMIEPFNSPIPVHLYTEQPGNLVDELVHKIGPSSSRTDGVIFIDPYQFSGSDLIEKRNYVIVKGKDENPFAKPGDSGAVVFRIQFENGKPRAEIISTILYGPKESEKDEEFVVTHRLDEALQELAEQVGMVVNFDDTQ